MKKLFMTAVLVLSSSIGVSFNVQAAPQIEPGPVQELNEQANEAVDVLLKVSPKDLAQFRKYGNTTKTISLQMLEPGKAVYVFTREQCMVGGVAGGVCLGGAQLQVTVESVPGNMPTEKVTSRVLILR